MSPSRRAIFVLTILALAAAFETPLRAESDQVSQPFGPGADSLVACTHALNQLSVCVANCQSAAFPKACVAVQCAPHVAAVIANCGPSAIELINNILE